MKQTNTTIASWAVVIKKALNEYDVDSEQLFLDADISLESLTDPLNRIPVHSLTRLWNAAVEATQDDGLGLRVATFVTPNTFFALGMSSLASCNGIEAVKLVSEYSSLISTGMQLSIRHVDSLYCLEFSNKPGFPEYAPAATDAALATALHMIRHYIGIRAQPNKVSFRHAAPSNTRLFEDYFGCEIEFNAERNALYSPDIQYALCMFPTANSALFSCCVEMISKIHNRLSIASISQRVQRELDIRLRSEKRLDQRSISRALGVSERKLQNELKKEGTTFQALLDGVRERKAIYLLTVDNQPVGSVAAYLGFSEISSFTRAFKRWTGTTPKQYSKTVHRAADSMPQYSLYDSV